MTNTRPALNGTARPLGRIVLADDAVAADATCAGLIGFEPEKIVHIRDGSRFLGNVKPTPSDQIGAPYGIRLFIPCGSRISELLCALKHENRWRSEKSPITTQECAP